jgi:queuine tRNA-ribosyltransferase
MHEAGTQIILSNTYHLMLQPGPSTMRAMGGIHKFTGWNGPMLTDSGGFQIFSLGHGSVAQEIKGTRNSGYKSLCKITEEGAEFRSYLDGSKQLLTPERSIQIQRDIGADLILVLDECTPFHVSKQYTARSMEMSHRWAMRSLAEFERGDDGTQSLYGIVQGGVYEDLRVESASFVNSQKFFGVAVGGSLGRDKEQMMSVVDTTMKMIDRSRPVHLLGIGGIQDILHGVECGIDTFDCVHPTRIARHGCALVEDVEGKEHVNLSNARFRLDTNPIDAACDCYTCRHFSRGYIHHLIKARELLAMQLLTIHNVRFMNRLMERIRSDIRRRSVAR